MGEDKPSGVWAQFPNLVEHLKMMFSENLSFGVMAERLGHGVSRNAVIGKATRLGLKRAKKKQTKQMVLPRQTQRFRINESIPIAVYEETLDMTPTVDDANIPLEQRKTILTVGPEDCRFPVGEVSSPDFFFCGAPKIEGSPYCHRHSKLCFTQPVRKSLPVYVPTRR